MLRFLVKAEHSVIYWALGLLTLALFTHAIIGQDLMPSIMTFALASVIAIRARYESITAVTAARQCLQAFKTETEHGG